MDSETLTLVVEEHRALRATMDTLLLREGELTRFQLVIAGGAIPVILKFPPVDRITLLAGAALLLSAVAWVINLQYWDILWHEYYILTRLRPRAVQLVGGDVLGYEAFTRDVRERPRSFIALVAAGSVFFHVVVLAPPLIYGLAALYVSSDLHVPILLGQWILLSISSVLFISLITSVVWGYWARWKGVM